MLWILAMSKILLMLWKSSWKKENPAWLLCTSLGGRGGCFGVGCFGQVGPVERAPHREPPNPQPGQYVMVMLACPTFVIHLCDNWDRCSHVQPPAESGLSLWWWDLDLRWAEKEKMAHSLPFPYNPASLAPNTTPHHQVSQQPLCENIKVKKKSNLFDISTVSDKIGTFWRLSLHLRTCGLNIFVTFFHGKLKIEILQH